jgi:cellobiose phosphorylase
MYRLITESLLGLRLEVDRLHINPLFPAGWDSFDIHYRYRETFYHIHVHKGGDGTRAGRVVCDGIEQPERVIPLLDDRRDHHVEVEVAIA